MKFEADFTLFFRHWVRGGNFPALSCAIEIKQTRTDSLAFAAVKDHQIAALQAAKKSLLYKIPDDSRGIKPCDMMYLCNAHAFIVIKFPEYFCIIDVDVFVGEKEKSDRKSLTAERAKSIAFMTVNF